VTAEDAPRCPETFAEWQCDRPKGHVGAHHAETRPGSWIEWVDRWKREHVMEESNHD